MKTGDFDGKENMLTLLLIPGDVARWVSAVFAHLSPQINLSEQASQHAGDTARISPANLSAPVIINLNLDIFSQTGKRTALWRLNVNAAV